MTTPKIYGTTIFCDDIRDEVGGKKTLVGCYLDTLVAPQAFPFVLPTFGFRISVVESFEDAEGPLQIRIVLDAEEGEQVTVIEADLPSDRNSKLVRDDDSEFFTSLIALRVSPFRIEQRGKLKVRAYRHGEEIRLGALKVIDKSDAEAGKEERLNAKYMPAGQQNDTAE